MNSQRAHHLLHLLDIIISVLLYMWTILFLLIIHERFVCFTKLLQENVTLTNNQIVGERNPRQLTEVVQLFSDTWIFVNIGLAVIPIIIDWLFRRLAIRSYPVIDAVYYIQYSVFIQITRIVVLISICQANKAELRGLIARHFKHLVAFETNREIILQVQQLFTLHTDIS